MTDIPNCSTCDKKMSDSNGFVICKATGEILSFSGEAIGETHGCLSHPQAREYLMEGVLKELEQRLNDENNKYYAMFANSKSLYIHLEEAISLIRNGVKK